MTRYWHLDEDDDEPKKKDEAGNSSSFIDQKLFGSRYIVLTGPITMDLARGVTEKLLAMAAEDAEKPIHLLINSPGGHVESGDTIFDMIRFIEPPVKVIGSGWVASAAAHIYLSVSRENRYCLPNTRFMLHQPSGGAGGPASDIAIQAKEIIKTKARINRVIAEQTGQPLERVIKDTERDHWMTADEALEYGMVGKIIRNVREISA